MLISIRVLILLTMTLLSARHTPCSSRTTYAPPVWDDDYEDATIDRRKPQTESLTTKKLLSGGTPS